MWWNMIRNTQDYENMNICKLKYCNLKRNINFSPIIFSMRKYDLFIIHNSTYFDISLNSWYLLISLLKEFIDYIS